MVRLFSMAMSESWFCALIDLRLNEVGRLILSASVIDMISLF